MLMINIRFKKSKSFKEERVMIKNIGKAKEKAILFIKNILKRK